MVIQDAKKRSYAEREQGDCRLNNQKKENELFNQRFSLLSPCESLRLLCVSPRNKFHMYTYKRKNYAYP